MLGSMRRRTKPKPATVPLLYAIEPHLLDIGRRKAYEQAREGELVDGVPVIRVGNSSRVPVAPLERVLGIELDLDDLERWLARRADTKSRSPAA